MIQVAKLQGLKRLGESLHIDGKILIQKQLLNLCQQRVNRALRIELEQRGEQKITHRMAVHIASYMNIPYDRVEQIKCPNLLGMLEVQMREYNRISKRITALQSPAQAAAR